MKKLVLALVSAGFNLPTDASDEQLETCVVALINKHKELESENSELKESAAAEKEKADKARKERIEAHVKSKTWLSPELQAKWIEQIVKDDSAQALLDSMQAPTAPAPGRAPRGAAPPPPEPNDQDKTDEEKLAELREQMKSEKDPSRLAVLARQARVLRGHADIASAPASQRVYAMADGKFVVANQ